MSGAGPAGEEGGEEGGLPEALADLLERFRRGERAALARAITTVEDGRGGFQDFLHAVLGGELRAGRIGLTGPPGAGKSTLATALCRHYREEDRDVGIVAVDPTSPFSGGALLGDRIRMNDLATDPGVFIRSMATRGSLGGLAVTTKEVMDLMDAFGFDRVLVETVGVGQTELEITAAADTVVVVLVPESGDAIQAMKAGLMEIADVFVVNKADRPGADRVARELRTSIQLRRGEALRGVPAHHGVDLRRAGKGGEEASPDSEGAAAWEIPVLKTVAETAEGIAELAAAVDGHREWLAESGELERRRTERARSRIRDVVERELRRRVWSDARSLEIVEEGLERVTRGRETPYSVARTVVEALAPGSDESR